MFNMIHCLCEHFSVYLKSAIQIKCGCENRMALQIRDGRARGSSLTVRFIHETTDIPHEERSRTGIAICSILVNIACTMKIVRGSALKLSEVSNKEC